MKLTDTPTRLLLGPGPSPVSPEVLTAQARPPIGHLDPVFLEVMDDVRERLRAVFQTSNQLTLPISGTGSAGMEAALVNVLEPGDTAVVGVNGVFGARIAEIVRRAGANPVIVEAPWGEAVSVEDVARALENHDDVRIVAVVHAETSTGVEQPLDEIGMMLQHRETLFVVDAVTSLGGIPVDVDRRGIDVCYSGTQKCLSAPPGLAPITFSEKAERRLSQRSTPVQSWYLDMNLVRQYWGAERVYHHTAPVNALYGLHAALGQVLDEGLEARFARHRAIGGQLHRALEERGWRLFAAEGFRLPQLTSAYPPEGKDPANLRRYLLEEHDIEIGGGLGPVAASIVRIGLMGHGCTAESLERLLRALDAF